LSKQNSKQEAAIAIVLNEKREQVLLVKRVDFDVWVLPGGGIDPGETNEAAAVREAKEESGYQIEIVQKLAEFSPINRLSQQTHIYEGRVIGGEATLSDESREVAFFLLNKLPAEFFPVHRDWLFELLKAKEYPVIRSLTEVNYPRLLWHILLHPIDIPKYLYRRFIGA